MLTCRDVAHEASDFIDHHQSWWHRVHFYLHLFICYRCRRLIRHVRLTRDFIRSRGRANASQEEVGAIMDTIRHCDHS